MLFTSLVFAAAVSGAAPQQPASGAGSSAQRPAVLMPAVKGVHFSISTRRDEAQKFFDQGLALVYGANYEEAIRSFRRAAEVDPGSPMPHWGIALASISARGDGADARYRAGATAIQRATDLSVRAPAKERAYVAALAKRFAEAGAAADQAQLAVAYRDAMRQLVRTYPNDMHAATLFAKSQIDLRPDALWTPTGAPAEGTSELVDVLERVLDREPDHLGANHYYIHATESSLTPERALKSAAKLEALAPGIAHLAHMPSHAYMRAGNYSGAATANARAVELDRAYIAEMNPGPAYEARYFVHDLDFLVSAAMMAGRFTDSMNAARDLNATAMRLLPNWPAVEPLAAKSLFVLLRFNKWKDVLALPAPPPQAPVLVALDHFGRGVAHAALGETTDAERERAAFDTARAAVPAGGRFDGNSTTNILAVAAAVLTARIVTAGDDPEAAVTAWQQAVAAEDALGFSAPPGWYYPTRESLGAALIRVKRYEQADLAFRQDLERNPNNGRSLWGRWQALRASDGDVPGTMVVRRRYLDAWADADTTLRLEDF